MTGSWCHCTSRGYVFFIVSVEVVGPVLIEVDVVGPTFGVAETVLIWTDVTAGAVETVAVVDVCFIITSVVF